MQDSCVPGASSVNLEGGENIPKEEQDQGRSANMSRALDVLRFMIEVLKALL